MRTDELKEQNGKGQHVHPGRKSQQGMSVTLITCPAIVVHPLSVALRSGVCDWELAGGDYSALKESLIASISAELYPICEVGGREEGDTHCHQSPEQNFLWSGSD
jgi:hypothetical protein